MLEHYIQRNIVYRLAFASGLSFSELKPDDLDNKLFTYHLKKVMAAGLVKKSETGHYELTPEGRRVGIYISEKQLAFVANRPESVLFLVIRRKADGAWLLYKRTVHPLIGRVGFMHALPRADQTCEAVAAKTCFEKTGLSASFRVLGSGYFRVYEGDNLESFTHFTLLVCEDVSGTLQPHDETAEYFWMTAPDFRSSEMLPDMATLVAHYQTNDQFFVEETLQI